MLVTKILKKLKNKSKIWKQSFLIRRKYRFLFQESWLFFQECQFLKQKRLKKFQSKRETHLLLKVIRLHQKSNISTRNLILDLITTINTQKNALKRHSIFITLISRQIMQTWSLCLQSKVSTRLHPKALSKSSIFLKNVKEKKYKFCL